MFNQLINTVHLLPQLDQKLIELLQSLTPKQWQAQTIAKLWTVKDVAAHLLDGNIRILSMLRDGYQGEKPDIQSYQGLLDYLNALNADWVKAMKRVSPQMLILLHEATGKSYCDYYASLNPFGKAGFAVAWAGETESKNWMHIAREYTEKWLHQQQIRDAVSMPGLMTREFFYPFIDTFMLALPYTYRDIKAENNTTIQLTVTSDIGGSWYLQYTSSQWKLHTSIVESPTAEITIDPDTSWKLFSKSITAQQVEGKVKIAGNQQLGKVALNMVSVMV